VEGPPSQETSQETKRIVSMIPVQMNSLKNPFDDDDAVTDDEMMSADGNTNESVSDSKSYMFHGNYQFYSQKRNDIVHLKMTGGIKSHRQKESSLVQSRPL
jgi:hypothetical protein